MSVSRTISLPRASQPFGLVFAPDGLAAYVALEGIGRVSRLDPVSGAELVSASVGARPRHVAVNAASTRLLVSRFVTPKLPGESTQTVLTELNGVKQGGEVLVLDAATMGILTTAVLQHSDDLDLADGGSGIPNYLGAPAISPDGTSAWVPSKKDNIKRGSAAQRRKPESSEHRPRHRLADRPVDEQRDVRAAHRLRQREHGQCGRVRALRSLPVRRARDEP